MTTPEKRAEWWRWVRGECSPQSTMDYRDAIAELLSALESYQSLEVREKAELAASLITEVRIEQAEEHAAHLERAMEWLAGYLTIGAHESYDAARRRWRDAARKAVEEA